MNVRELKRQLENYPDDYEIVRENADCIEDLTHSPTGTEIISGERVLLCFTIPIRNV